ncbi:hypothetical protein N658DRAFT_556125 [Parathielavia hyrcaniae]|uniref:Uncharacterized protein n=1 Tax=Parathielavia hyrcaniae TaxID=113614 RepID=A0AAN6QCH3_9PEZI|nr:hypothetical protein N658DRAFT_556125 [Parathielavia hyrcaniae]
MEVPKRDLRHVGSLRVRLIVQRGPWLRCAASRVALPVCTVEASTTQLCEPADASLEGPKNHDPAILPNESRQFRTFDTKYKTVTRIFVNGDGIHECEKYQRPCKLDQSSRKSLLSSTWPTLAAERQVHPSIPSPTITAASAREEPHSWPCLDERGLRAPPA